MNLEFHLKDVMGNSYRIKNPMSFSCIKTRETPADSLKVSFFQKDFLTISDDFQPEMTTIEIFVQSKRIFNGICDQQSIVADSSGGRIEIQARGLGALLLDNEALPQEYYRASLNQIFQNHIAQYHFINGIDNSVSLPLFTVSKGMSQWDAFSSFCGRATGKYPFLSENKVLIVPSSPQSLYIDNILSEGISEIRHTIKRCDVISSVFIRDENGVYSAQINNQQALDLGISRTRYLIPPPQWAGETKFNANLKLIESIQYRKQWIIKLSGLHQFNLGDRLSLKNYFRGLSVYEIDLIFNQSGLYTKLVLV